MAASDSSQLSEAPAVPSWRRIATAAALLILISAYTFAVLTGRVPPADRLDTAHLGAIVITLAACALLLMPQLGRGLKVFELYGLKLELSEVRKLQREQQVELSDVRLLIGMLIPEPERRHLENVARGETKLIGDASLHSELRKLTSLGLLRRVEGRDIGSLKLGVEQDLSDVVFVTDLGHRVVQRLKELAGSEPER